MSRDLFFLQLRCISEKTISPHLIFHCLDYKIVVYVKDHELWIGWHLLRPRSAMVMFKYSRGLGHISVASLTQHSFTKYIRRSDGRNRRSHCNVRENVNIFSSVKRFWNEDPLWSSGHDTCLPNGRAVVRICGSANAFEPIRIRICDPVITAKAVGPQPANVPLRNEV